jgi:hypothetical protein
MFEKVGKVGKVGGFNKVGKVREGVRRCYLIICKGVPVVICKVPGCLNPALWLFFTGQQV